MTSPQSPNFSTPLAIIGLGYVGLPLAIEFGKHYRTIGYDLSQTKIDAYLRGEDPTGEVGAEAGPEAGLGVGPR